MTNLLRCRRCRVYGGLCLLVLAGLIYGLCWFTYPIRLAARFKHAWENGNIETLNTMLAGQWKVSRTKSGYLLKPLREVDYGGGAFRNLIVSVNTLDKPFPPLTMSKFLEPVTDYFIDREQYNQNCWIMTEYEGGDDEVQWVFVDHDGVRFVVVGAVVSP